MYIGAPVGAVYTRFTFRLGLAPHLMSTLYGIAAELD